MLTFTSNYSSQHHIVWPNILFEQVYSRLKYGQMILKPIIGKFYLWTQLDNASIEIINGEIILISKICLF